jgi:hypothetical protein
MASVSELNKRKVRLFVEAVWNEGRLDMIEELVANDYVGHLPCLALGVVGPRGVRQLISSRRCSHPGLHIRIEDQLAEEDRVVTRWHATAPARDVPAGGTGPTPACLTGISIIRLLAGKQVDSHTECTTLTASFNASRPTAVKPAPQPSGRKETSAP